LMACLAVTGGLVAVVRLVVLAPKETQEQLVCLGALDKEEALVYLEPRGLR